MVLCYSSPKRLRSSVRGRCDGYSSCHRWTKVRSHKDSALPAGKILPAFWKQPASFTCAFEDNALCKYTFQAALLFPGPCLTCRTQCLSMCPGGVNTGQLTTEVVLTIPALQTLCYSLKKVCAAYVMARYSLWWVCAANMYGSQKKLFPCYFSVE